MTIIVRIELREVLFDNEMERDASRKIRFTDKLDAIELLQKVSNNII